jgi:hypothetical protein
MQLKARKLKMGEVGKEVNQCVISNQQKTNAPAGQSENAFSVIIYSYCLTIILGSFQCEKHNRNSKHFSLHNISSLRKKA